VWLKIANRHQTRKTEFSDFRDMTISDLSATDYGNIQRHLLTQKLSLGNSGSLNRGDGVETLPDGVNRQVHLPRRNEIDCASAPSGLRNQ